MRGITACIFTWMKHAQRNTVQENYQHAGPFKPGAQAIRQGKQPAIQNAN